MTLEENAQLRNLVLVQQRLDRLLAKFGGGLSPEFRTKARELEDILNRDFKALFRKVAGPVGRKRRSPDSKGLVPSPPWSASAVSNELVPAWMGPEKPETAETSEGSNGAKEPEAVKRARRQERAAKKAKKPRPNGDTEEVTDGTAG